MLSIRCVIALLSVFTIFADVQCAPSAELEVFENLRGIPQGWHQGVSPPASKRLRFRIAVKQQNAFEFEELVLQISTPGHVKYGQHMKRDELKVLLRPSPEATNAIIWWLEAEGVPSTDIEDNGDWINFYVPTIEAERILNTRFYYYSSSINSVEKIRTLQYSVPKKLHQYIQMIQPTTRFGQMQAERSTVFDYFKVDNNRGSAMGEGYQQTDQLNVTLCNNTITPQCLRELYNVGDFNASATNGNKLGICGYLNQYAKYADLEQFLEKYAPNAASDNFTYVSVNGGLLLQNDTVDNDIEANLDVQYGLSLSYPTPSFYYSTGGLGELIPDLDQPTPSDDQNEPYLDFLSYVLALPDDQLPTTLTTSYGEDEQSVPEPYTNRTCSLFAQLGARGVSVLFSSGDTGVGSACQTNDGKNTTRFLPTFPAGCPYVTSVGGTHYVYPEQAVTFSSGGFSDRFPRPSYQEAAVSAYLDILGDKWEGLYNPNGRGIPDVAAQAARFRVIDKGREVLVGGTSAAAPTFAAIVSLLNSARLSANQPPLGFLNPWIYSVGYKGLNDIVNGGSRGCTGKDLYSRLPAPFVPYASWNATPGWDPVTGYGTPDFQKLLELSSGPRSYKRFDGPRHRGLRSEDFEWL